MAAYLGAFNGNILPAANVTYSLGDSTHQWKDLWVSNNTIYIGGTPIRVDGETLLINNLPISSASIIGNLQIDNNTNQLSFGPGESYSFLYMKNDGSETRLANDNGNVQISTIKQGPGGGTYYWTFNDTGNLTVPGNIISGTSYINFVANSSGDGYGFSTIELRPDTNAYEDSYLIIDPTYPSHIHIRAGGAQDNSLTELYLGGENSHFKVNNGLNPDVSIASNNYVWLFDTTGNITIPTEIIFGSSPAASSTGIIFGDGSFQNKAFTGPGDKLSNQGYDVTLDSFGTLTVPGNILFPGGSTYSNNTFVSPTSNGALNKYEWKFSDQAIGNDTITLQWNLLDTTLSQWYLSTNSQTKYLVFDGESQSLGFVGDSGGSGTVTFGATTNNGTGGINDIELTSATGNAFVRTGSNSWKFNQSGNLIFPDATVQTTAWTGTVNFGNAIAIGYNTGTVSQGSKAVAVGSTAGNVSQGTGAVAVGDRSGATSQGNLTVAVGSQAGEISQGLQATAVGSGAGNYNQGAGTVAIGTNAGAFNQGLRATAIGSLAGASDQGEYAVAIGNFAGGNNQGNNSIIINATGIALEQTTANTFTVKPIRNASGSSALYYDATTGEITYDTAGAGSYGNTEVAAYLPTYTGNAGAARVQVTNAVDFMYGGYPYMGWQLSGSDTLKLRTNIASGDYTDDAIIVDRQSLAVNVVATLTAGNIVTTNGLFWANGVAYSSGGGSGTDDVLRANVGAYQIYANANAAAQSISIVAINDNLISFQTYANANAATQQTSIDTKAPLASPTFSGTLTSGGNIAAQANVTVNNNLSVLGNLLVQGTTTTVNSTTLSITDKFITVANSSTNNSEANGAGIYVPGSSANILYTSVDDSWTLNKTIVGTANIKAASWVIGGVFAYANNVNILADVNSNAATQAVSINTLNANLGAYQAYANATFSVSTYSNTNVAGYLSGNITTGNVQVGSTMQLRGADNSISTTNGSSINIYSRVNISGSAVNVGLNVSGNLVVNQNSNATSFYGTNYFYTNGVSILSGIGGTYSNVNVEAYIGGNVGAYQVFANANAAAQATSINTINANLGAFQTYANTTFGVSSYSNTQVAAYLLTYPNVNVATLNTTSGNIVTLRTANFNSANAVISGGYISALTNASIVTATITTVNSTAGNVTTLAATNFSTANAVVTGGYATGLANISVTGNATVGNLVGTSPNTTIISGAYTSTFDNVGNVVLPNLYVSGNTTAMGIAAGYAPNRPAFRIYGGTPAWWTTANTNFKGSSIVVDYNQGGYFNSSTGVFTAPVTGLYQTTLNARIGSVNAQGQIIVLKNGLNTAGNALMMWEADTNTGTAVHFGVSTVVKLVAGDILTANITAGNIQFDQNDSWTVTYIG